MKTRTLLTLMLLIPFWVIAQNKFPPNDNVGIGTTNPQYLIDIVSNIDDYKQLRVKSPGSPLIKLSGSYNSGNGAELYQNPSGVLRLNVNSTKNGLLIKPNGNIGIGTTNPNQALVVNGSIALNYNEKGGFNGIKRDGVATEYYNNITQTDNSVIHKFTGVNKTIMSLTQGGNIGIGTENPDMKLTVNGNIHAKEVKIDLNIPAPDYVFKDDYDLKSIEEVEKFIEENNHLPDMPSAKEFEQNGVMQAEMDMNLLKKIEELTLYTIQQEKKINEQSNEIKKLKNFNKELVKLQSRIEKLESEK